MNQEKPNHLILEPTLVAEWHALLNEAKKASNIALSEELQNYLIFLLIHFTNKPEMANAILATDFLTHLHKIKAEDKVIMRDVGDQCLLYSGLFPGKAKQRHVPVHYYVELGKKAYFTLAAYPDKSVSALFSKLHDHFVGLMDILQTIRSLDETAESMDLLTAEELFHATQSRHALKLLKKATTGFLVQREPHLILPKQ